MRIRSTRPLLAADLSRQIPHTLRRRWTLQPVRRCICGSQIRLDICTRDTGTHDDAASWVFLYESLPVRRSPWASQRNILDVQFMYASGISSLQPFGSHPNMQALSHPNEEVLSTIETRLPSSSGRRESLMMRVA